MTSCVLPPSLLVSRTAPRVVAVSGSRPRMVRAVTVLPLPLSPTIASTSPAPTDRLTPLTAATVPASVAKLTDRLSMSTTSFVARVTATTLPLRNPRVPRARPGRRPAFHRERPTRLPGPGPHPPTDDGCAAGGRPGR